MVHHYFVSIHTNSFAGAANGTECYTYPSTDAKNKELSRNVSRAIANKFGIPNSCEHLVISDSEYEPFGGELPGIPDRYKYNFIEPAINKIYKF